MMGFKSTIDLLAEWAQYVQLHVAQAGWWPGTTTLAVGAVAAGVVLALWGNRLLRLIYVLTFIAAGGWLGVRVTRAANVDPLIGLVLGAGVAGLVGHLLYRCWVGVTAACCGALLVVVVAAIRNGSDVQVSISEFHEQRGKAIVSSMPAEAADASTGQGACSAALGQVASVARTYVGEAFAYLRRQRPDLVYRVAVVAVLAWFTGLGMGLTLPRFTAIVGTSLCGVLLMATGLGMLAYRHAPAVLETVDGHQRLFLACLGVVLLSSLFMQARRRQTPAPPAKPAPATRAA